ncbi:hypothetical protein TNCV_4521021 [Trichonephila clavipes]|nr:hypothetical protein TNCV_4521021 [Trichonephila clavipes]
MEVGEVRCQIGCRSRLLTTVQKPFYEVTAVIEIVRVEEPKVNCVALYVSNKLYSFLIELDQGLKLRGPASEALTLFRMRHE